MHGSQEFAYAWLTAAALGLAWLAGCYTTMGAAWGLVAVYRRRLARAKRRADARLRQREEMRAQVERPAQKARAA